MTAITASEARANLYRLIDEAASSHQPLLVTGKRNYDVIQCSGSSAGYGYECYYSSPSGRS